MWFQSIHRVFPYPIFLSPLCRRNFRTIIAFPVSIAFMHRIRTYRNDCSTALVGKKLQNIVDYIFCTGSIISKLGGSMSPSIFLYYSPAFSFINRGFHLKIVQLFCVLHKRRYRKNTS